MWVEGRSRICAGSRAEAEPRGLSADPRAHEADGRGLASDIAARIAAARLLSEPGIPGRSLPRDGPGRAGIAAVVESAAQERERVGDWFLKTVALDDGSRFCTATGPSTIDSALQLILTDASLNVAVLSERWTGNAGDLTRLQMSIDDRWQDTQIGPIVSANYLMVQFPDDDPVIEHLRRGQHFTIIQEGETRVSFDLTGSNALLDAMFACRDGPDGTSPAAPVVANPVAPQVGAQAGAAFADPVSPAPIGQPVDLGPPAIGSDRPRPPRYIVPHVDPEMTFEMFALSVQLVVPGNPEVSRREPGDRFADYEFRGATENGIFVGKYFEVAPQGATIAELLNRYMYIGEATCDGEPRAFNRDGERIGETVVAWEGIDCGGSSGVQHRSAVVSGDRRQARVFMIYGQPSTQDAAVALYDMLRKLARQR